MARLTDLYSSVDFLAWDLSVDHAVTTTQAYRWYGLRRQELVAAGLVLESRRLKPTKNAVAARSVTFVVASRKQARASTVALYHLAGTAEVRAVLGVGHERWSSTAWREAATMIPDAIWSREDGVEVAIEFDTGAYTRERIVRKAEAFASFDGGQVWGSPTERRAVGVRDLVSSVDPSARVLVAAAT